MTRRQTSLRTLSPRWPVLGVISLLAAAGCAATDEAATTTGDPAATAPTATTTPAPSTSAAAPSASAGSSGTSTGQEPTADTLPDAVQGLWARVDLGDAAAVTAEQCVTGSETAGSLIEVDATSVRVFESTATLVELEESDETSATGTFIQITGEAESELTLQLDAQGPDGLIVEGGDFLDGQTGPKQFQRCPG